MGTYTSYGEYAEKWQALASRAQGMQTTARGRRRFVSLLAVLDRVNARYARIALRLVKRILVREIYSQYIPSKEEYKKSRELSPQGRREVARLKKMPGFEVGLATAAAILRGEPREQARARRRVGFAGLQQAHRGRLRVMSPLPLGPRAWRRTGELLKSETVAHGTDVRGDMFIVLKNDARNKQGGYYARARSALGTQGARRNSIWTRAVEWQTEALQEVYQDWRAAVVAAVHIALHQ